jgi:uncharacterized protein
MKNVFRNSVATLAVLFASACVTAPAAVTTTAPAAFPVAVTEASIPVATPDAAGPTPAMWKVQDADTTIYLFGTMHLLPPGEQWLTGEVRRAFDSASTLRMELASLDPTPAEAQSMMGRGMAAPGSAPLTSLLTDAEKATLAAAAGKIGLPVQAIDGMRPWLVSLLTAVAMATELGLDPSTGAEKVLTRLANESGKTIEGFETFDQQIGFFANMPDDLSLASLKIGLAQYADASNMMQRMLDAWMSGDAARLDGIMNEGLETTPEVRKVLLEDRNRRWADWIDSRMDQPGTVFVAVGGGHLVGHDSVQVFLQQHGHTSVQVTGKR